MSAAARAIDGFGAELTALLADQEQGEPLASVRAAALERFAAAGFPTTRDEAWKYTNLRRLTRREFTAAEAPGPIDTALLQRALPDPDSVRMVFVDGHFDPLLSTAAELLGPARVTSLGAALRERSTALAEIVGRSADHDGHRFAALNTALFRDGAWIELPDGAVLEQPLHLVFVASARRGAAVHPRVIVTAGRSSRIELVEHFLGTSAAEWWTNSLTEISVGAGAAVEHYRIQDEAESAFHIGGVHVRQAADSRYVSHNVALGGRIARMDVQVHLDAPGAECTLNGLFLADGRRHVDNHTRIDHHAAHTRSEEIYRGVLDGRGRGVFNGKVVVHAGAQRIAARQTSDNLLLSDDAEIDTKPELEIYADDVSCSHGATVGQLDREALFYLLSRGIDRPSAEALLVFAFAEVVIGRMSLPGMRDRLDAIVRERLRDGARIGAIE